jgi:zona occludens toxin (predicted ATPase)
LYYIGCLKHKYYVYNKQKNKSGSRSVQIIQKIKGRNKIFKIIGCATTQQEEDDKEKNSIFINSQSLIYITYIFVGNFGILPDF